MQEEFQLCRNQLGHIQNDVDMSVDASENISQLTIQKAGDRFICEDLNTGLKKKKQIIFKIIKERDAEYIVEMDDLADASDSTSQSSSHTDSANSDSTTDTLKDASTNELIDDVVREVVADPKQYKQIYKLCHRRISKIDMQNSLQSYTKLR